MVKMWINSISCSLVLLVLLSVGVNEGDCQFIPIFDWVRSFFGSYEAPPFTSVRNITDEVEERIYPSKYWACTEEFLTPTTKDSKKSEMFMSLFQFIQGKNDQGQKIEMTVPVATKVDHRNGKLRSYKMCFFVPEDFQASPPNPTNPKITLVKFPELHVYSKLFGGYSSESIEHEEMMGLSGLLKNESIPYFEDDQGDRATYFIAGYDSPTKFWNRRNEIWLLSKDTKKSINTALTADEEE